MVSRESLREIAIGKFYLKKTKEVGIDKISQNEIDAYEAGFLDCYDRFFDKPEAIRLPLYQVNSADFRIPESKL